MQFIPNGPDIPDALLQAHEEGRVVFFCGAGISYPAELPGFKGLVEEIYSRCGTNYSEIERKAFKSGQFDTTLELLERRLPGQRMAIRQKLAEILIPNLNIKGATDTHEALLHLARNSNGKTRLVTTNFDRLFQEAANRTNQTFKTYAAPLLPIPKNSRWDGLVFLHGLLTEAPSETDLNNLVVTSGDFGLAYLAERWAARFVSELFKNYVVCFIGYSINDPILRYMMDALAADRNLGEITPQAWALSDCITGQEPSKKDEWQAKGVAPILYKVPTHNPNDHSALHQTLHAWAQTYRDGVQSKEEIINQYATIEPVNSTLEDNFIGRIVWALSDATGLPAKRFANFNPAPSLNWFLDVFSTQNLNNKEIAQSNSIDSKSQFGLINLQLQNNQTPLTQLVSSGGSNNQLDTVIYQIARWLVRHLNDPRLILWISDNGANIHSDWAKLIEDRLTEIDRLVRNNKHAELDKLSENSPNAIPSKPMQALWRLLLCGRVKTSLNSRNFYNWKSRFEREGVTTTIRLELRELLSPKVALKKRDLWEEKQFTKDEPLGIKHFVNWDLVLTTSNIRSTLPKITDPLWEKALPNLITDFQQLLLDALDLIKELNNSEEVNNFYDSHFLDLQSISPHKQNRYDKVWVILIELLRDSWIAIQRENPTRARHIAIGWFDLPYTTFKRLALFAASQNDCIPPEIWVDWLLEKNAWCLWSISTRREVYRLFVLQGSQLKGHAQKHLESAILAGPPLEKHESTKESHNLSTETIWLHLAKLQESRLVLEKQAAARFVEISKNNPLWHIEPDESDEFLIWVGNAHFIDHSNNDLNIVPRKRDDIVQWLLQRAPQKQDFYNESWQHACQKYPINCLFALADLALQGRWPNNEWKIALNTWSEYKNRQRIWQHAAPILRTMPNNIFQEIVRSIAWWVSTSSKSINHHEEVLFELCNRVLTLFTDAKSGGAFQENRINQTITDAINHPVGQVTEALLNHWFKKLPNDKDLLPINLKSIFTTICDISEVQFVHGRVILASRLIALFRIDQSWTEQYLLPLFYWSNPVEAKAMWNGFLWSPRLYQPLLSSFKSQFLETVKHYEALDDCKQNFATFLTYAALGPTKGYSTKDFRTAFESLPQKGLEKCALALSQTLKDTSTQRENYWKHRVLPFWQNIWPKSIELATPRIAKLLTELIISTGNEFPTALATFKDWLQEIEDADIIIMELYNDTKLCTIFPKETLQLLSQIIDFQRISPNFLGDCLRLIQEASPLLEHDQKYKNLKTYVRKYRGD